MKYLFLLGFIFVFSHTVQAKDFNKRRSSVRTPSEETPLCQKESVDLRNVPIGFKCVSSKNKTFERVSIAGFGEAWKSSDGVIWSDLLKSRVSKPDGDKICNELNVNAKLPTIEIFQNVYSFGANEVLPHVGRYWSAEAHISSTGRWTNYLAYDLRDGTQSTANDSITDDVRCIIIEN